MVGRRAAIRATQVALSIIVVILVGLLAFTAGSQRFVTRTVTSTTTQTMSAGSTEPPCSPAAPLQGLPAGGYWFTARVNYSGPWVALAVIYDRGTSILAKCYTGVGQGFFEHENSSFDSAAMIRITASKLDGGTGALTAAVNGNINSTSAPYGSVTVSASVSH
jgi:hypothetical protein